MIDQTRLMRTTYIEQVLHLTHDPFRLLSAEQEFVSQDVGPQRFYNYFVEPQPDLLKNLSKPEHSLIYAEVGHGKTTLRYHLEESLRTMLAKTAVISVRIDETTLAQPPETVAEAWLHSFTADLFIQTLELFPQFSQTLQQPELISRLAELVVASGWQREIARYIAKPLAERRQGGLSAWWPAWGRPSIDLIPLTDEREAFLQAIGWALVTVAPVNQESEKWLTAAAKIAKRIGFEHVFFAVDVIGSLGKNGELRPLWEQISRIVEVNNLYLKAFLPYQDESFFKIYLTKVISSYTISWSEQALHQIISQRFRSGGSRVSSLAWYAEASFAHQLNSLLVNFARNSPRRLLQIIDNLIEAHLKGGFSVAYITADDWQATVASGRNAVPHSNPITIKHEYQHTLFVNRHEELKKALNWVTELTTMRLMVLTAPPKAGKSWFLRHFCQQLTNGEYVFVDVLAHLHDGDLDLRHLVNQLSLALVGEPLHPMADIVAHIEQIAHKAQGSKILVFDGLDEVHQSEHWDEFQHQVLSPLHRNAAKLRFVLALREEFKIPYKLKKETFDLELLPFNQDQANEQIEKLSSRSLPIILAQYNLNRNYQGNHAGTNAFVAQLSDLQSQTQFPVDNYIGTLDVLQPERYPEAKQLLLVVFSLEKEEWTTEEFKEGYSLQTGSFLSVIELSAKINFLAENMLIQAVPPFYYCLIPGLSILSSVLH